MVLLLPNYKSKPLEAEGLNLQLRNSYLTNLSIPRIPVQTTLYTPPLLCQVVLTTRQNTIQAHFLYCLIFDNMLLFMNLYE